MVASRMLAPGRVASHRTKCALRASPKGATVGGAVSWSVQPATAAPLTAAGRVFGSVSRPLQRHPQIVITRPLAVEHSALVRVVHPTGRVRLAT
jgi:hypothetical protein